jgi:hypothetical protein
MPPPKTTKIVPPVTAVALMATNFSRVVRRGRDAESPARINRLIPNAIKIKPVSPTPVAPAAIEVAAIATTIAREIFERKRIRCREKRSRMVPTKGPTKE